MGDDFDKHYRYQKLKDNNQFNIIHTNGYAMRENLRDFVVKVNPFILMPFHTNNPSEFDEIISLLPNGGCVFTEGELNIPFIFAKHENLVK